MGHSTIRGLISKVFHKLSGEIAIEQWVCAYKSKSQRKDTTPIKKEWQRDLI